MGTIGIGGRQHDLGIARQLDVARLERPVCQEYAAYFGSIVGRNRDFSHRVDVTIATNEGDAVTREENAVPLRLRTRRLMSRRPDVTGAEILYVAPLAEVVASTVVSPTSDSEISVATESAAGVRDQSRVGNVAENSDHRLGRVWRLDLAHCWLLHLARHPRHIVALNVLNSESPRDALLQDQLRRADQRIHVEPPRPYLPIERVVQCNQAHPNVMRHERADDSLP